MVEVLADLNKALRQEEKAKLWRKKSRLTASDERLAKASIALGKKVMALRAEKGLKSAKKRNFEHKNIKLI